MCRQYRASWIYSPMQYYDDSDVILAHKVLRYLSTECSLFSSCCWGFPSLIQGKQRGREGDPGFQKGCPFHMCLSDSPHMPFGGCLEDTGVSTLSSWRMLASPLLLFFPPLLPPASLRPPLCNSRRPDRLPGIAS